MHHRQSRPTLPASGVLLGQHPDAVGSGHARDVGLSLLLLLLCWGRRAAGWRPAGPPGLASLPCALSSPTLRAPPSAPGEALSASLELTEMDRLTQVILGHRVSTFQVLLFLECKCFQTQSAQAQRRSSNSVPSSGPEGDVSTRKGGGRGGDALFQAWVALSQSQGPGCSPLYQARLLFSVVWVL